MNYCCLPSVCRAPHIGHLNRFAFLTAMLLVSGLAPLVAAPPTALPEKESETNPVEHKAAKSGENVSAEVALAMLKEGNKRFLSGKSEHPHEDPDWRSKLKSGQKPFATILGCSDSRVTPELIFDEGLGDLFVIRVAGNIVDDDVLASIEYAVANLDTHLVVVLGHEKCGAVTAAMQHLSSGGPRELTSLVQHIHDEIREHHDGEPDVGPSTDIDTAVHKNTRCSQRALKLSPELKRVSETHAVKIVGAIYDLDGRVRWLD
ncbi:Carbonic anhydrase 2 [Novipirellula aureliae]|uniref:Carbonic anhydrase n=1 Tax=Novipirellula aureliae TaxID=2527966 RepID=A0A5C6E921_9BACT|nr:carbonic anhydrase [Novipirellula aureliae]TWU45328.1 Carbonic anhydrase 2 [Novipirellula aureliae]